MPIPALSHQARQPRRRPAATLLPLPSSGGPTPRGRANSHQHRGPYARAQPPGPHPANQAPAVATLRVRRTILSAGQQRPAAYKVRPPERRTASDSIRSRGRRRVPAGHRRLRQRPPAAAERSGAKRWSARSAGNWIGDFQHRPVCGGCHFHERRRPQAWVAEPIEQRSEIHGSPRLDGAPDP